MLPPDIWVFGVLLPHLRVVDVFIARMFGKSKGRKGAFGLKNPHLYNKTSKPLSEVLRNTHYALLSILSSSSPSLPRRHPDILHLRRLVQELMTFALLAIHPIARQATAFSPPPQRGNPRLLNVLQKTFRSLGENI